MPPKTDDAVIIAHQIYVDDDVGMAFTMNRVATLYDTFYLLSTEHNSDLPGMADDTTVTVTDDKGKVTVNYVNPIRHADAIAGEIHCFVDYESMTRSKDPHATYPLLPMRYMPIIGDHSCGPRAANFISDPNRAMSHARDEGGLSKDVNLKCEELAQVAECRKYIVKEAKRLADPQIEEYPE